MNITEDRTTAEVVHFNGKITTLELTHPEASPIAFGEGEVLGLDDPNDFTRISTAETKRINFNGRAAIPGLNDPHLHVIRAGLFCNLELHWNGMPFLSQARL